MREGDSAESDPEHQALLADSIGLALLVVLDTLTPAERVAFILHDIFAIPFDQIAPIVDRSTPATRQLASRARARVQQQDATQQADRLRQSALVDAFLAAARNGDFDALLALLDPTSSSAPTSTPSSWAQPERPEGHNTSPPSHNAPTAPNPRSSTTRRRRSGCQAAGRESSWTSPPADTGSSPSTSSPTRTASVISASSSPKTPEAPPPRRRHAKPEVYCGYPTSVQRWQQCSANLLSST